MPGFVGPWELLIVGVILIAIFGTAKLPVLGRQAGKVARQAKREVHEVKAAMLGSDELAAEKGTSAPLTAKSALDRLLD